MEKEEKHEKHFEKLSRVHMNFKQVNMELKEREQELNEKDKRRAEQVLEKEHR